MSSSTKLTTRQINTLKYFYLCKCRSKKHEPISFGEVWSFTDGRTIKGLRKRGLVIGLPYQISPFARSRVPKNLHHFFCFTLTRTGIMEVEKIMGIDSTREASEKARGKGVKRLAIRPASDPPESKYFNESDDLPEGWWWF